MIIKEWLDKDLHSFLEKEFLYNTPHHYGHRSSPESTDTFYSTELNPNDPLTRFLFFKLTDSLKKNLTLNRVYINVQHPNMNGSFHIDGGSTLTCIYMVTGDGAFQIKNQGKVKFEKNKLVCFDSSKLHRGLAPSQGVRITLAFKTTEVDKQ